MQSPEPQSSPGSAGNLGKLRHLAVETPHMHNLTDLVQQSLVLKRSKGQSRYAYTIVLPVCLGASQFKLLTPAMLELFT